MGKLRRPVPPARKLAAESVRAARSAAGLTQEAAELRFGVSARTIGAMERGEVPMLALELVIGLRLAAAGSSREEQGHASTIALVIDGASSRLTNRTQKTEGTVAFGARNEKAAGLLEQPITPHTAKIVSQQTCSFGNESAGSRPAGNSGAADLLRGRAARSARLAHNQEVAGSNPARATTGAPASHVSGGSPDEGTTAAAVVLAPRGRRAA